MKNSLIALLLFGFSGLAFAAVPIVDLSQAATPDSTSSEATQVKPVEAVKPQPVPAKVEKAVPESVSSSGSLDERVARLERQMKVLTSNNGDAARLDRLEKNMQKLNGQSDVNAHDVKVLKKELQDFYKDLEGRLNKIKVGAKDSSGATSKIVAGEEAKAPKEQKAYEKAFSDLQNKKFKEAKWAFASYLKHYPKGTYAVNAHYWLGEIFYLTSEFAKAEKQFKIIVAKYPKSIKLPDSMLKIAIMQSADGRHKEAKKGFLAIEKRFPKTSTAKLAKQQLEILEHKVKGKK